MNSEAVNSDFVVGPSEESNDDDSFRGRFKRSASKCSKSRRLANFIVVVILIDGICTCRDIDCRAQNLTTPLGFRIVSDICLAIYIGEFLLHFCLEGCKIFMDWIIVLDFLVILCGILELVVGRIMQDASLGGISVARALRLGRVLRLTRFLRKLRSLRELHKLATMMTTCAKTLVWSFLLCFVVMTVWSMLMVEAVNPLMQQLQQESGTFTECGQRCQRAMTSASWSVMDANLLLFQTVIAGDGWGEIAVPLIQSYPQTAIILMGSFMTLVFGVLNLVVAVVVDTFADARQNDVQNLAEEMEDEVEYDRMSLAKLFARIDADGSGQVTLDELIEGARKDPIFQSRLRVMDIDESDLQMLFEMIDVDGSGSIEAAEFIGPLSRWAHDSKTAPRFIKYNLMQSMKIQEDMYDLCEDCFQHLALQIDKVYGEVKGLRSQPVKSMKFDGSSPTAPQGSPSVPGGSAALNCKEATKEHVFSVNLSRKVALLTGTASAASGSAAAAQQTELQLDISMERVVAQLECSVQRLECSSSEN
ncbi:Voltage-dependent calcium channel type A subunit alpha-1 (Cacophony protein) [Durusdinium trenchii]|uniref:Voltage-dependent calcium channel type A subunit alpha-1 (Cacophony protein) n=1 Tax=Durusdinium trenchii TaxID=1381693 RepID=A0ABP0KHK3_9DINO